MLIHKYIYGPVTSWRLGRSLGIDPISSRRKICTFDCIYCQVGRSKPYSGKRRIFVPTKKLIQEFKSLPPLKIDYITLSGTGEPALAKNLGQIIKAIRQMRKEKIAVFTNSTLLSRKGVQNDLLLADFVMAKLDASSQAPLLKVNQPSKSQKFKNIIKGIKAFKSRYRGKLALQIMFVKANKEYAEEIAKVAKDINPDEIQINTPLRPGRIRALTRKEIKGIMQYFKGMKVITVYDKKKKRQTEPINKKGVLRRRGKDV